MHYIQLLFPEFNCVSKVKVKRTLGIPLPDGTADIIKGNPQLTGRKCKHAVFQSEKQLVLHDVKLQIIEEYTA